MSCGPCSNAKSVVLLFQVSKKNSFSPNWKLICDSNDNFWLKVFIGTETSKGCTNSIMSKI